MSMDPLRRGEADQVLGMLASVHPPNGMNERLLRRIRQAEAETAGARWSGWMLALGSVFAVAVAGVFGVTWMRPVRPVPTHPEAIAAATPVPLTDDRAHEQEGGDERGGPDVVHPRGEPHLAAAGFLTTHRRRITGRLSSAVASADAAPDAAVPDASPLPEMKASVPGQPLPKFDVSRTPGQPLPKLEISAPGRPLPGFDMAETPGQPLPSFANATNTGDQP